MLAAQRVSDPRSVAILRVQDEGSSVAFARDSRRVGLPVLQGIPGVG
jgi:hypothetical protein